MLRPIERRRHYPETAISEEHPVFPYLMAIEEGVMEASNIGVLKGFPVTDVKIYIHDASFNNPEFARLTLKMAAYEAFRDACLQAGPDSPCSYYVPHSYGTK